MKKQYITGLAFGAAGMLAVFALMMYLLSTTGFLGLVIWEKSYRLYVILVGLLGVVSLGLGLFSHVKAMRIITVAYACLLTAVAIGGSIFVYSLGTRTPEALPNLRFYASSDGYLKTEKSISLAIASDAHFGAASANEEARNQIMDTVNGGGYDLFVMGGDLLDLGYDKSHTEMAIRDMEAYLTNVPVHFLMGNHDALVNTEANFRRYFQPGETYFNHVLEVAPGVHIVVFNLLWGTPDLKKSDVEWLSETLSKLPEEDTVIVVSHCFYYGSGYVSEGGGKWYDLDGVIKKIVPIFEENGVDLVLSGHQHSMELMEQNGIYYALVGPFGGSLFENYEIKTAANQLFYEGYTYGFVSLDIADDALTLTFRDAQGASLYATEIPTR